MQNVSQHNVSIGAGIFSQKDDVRDYIGYNGIKGYHSHYETVNVDYEWGDEEKEVQIYDCDHWTGLVILEMFNWMFLPLLLLIPYLTWRLLTE